MPRLLTSFQSGWVGNELDIEVGESGLSQVLSRLLDVGEVPDLTDIATHGSSGPVRCAFIHGMAIATRRVQEGGVSCWLLGDAFGRSLTRVWVRRAAQ